MRVDDDDPAFEHPTKPVGPFYTEEDAQRLSRERGWVVGEDSGRGWRCMVASPKPVEILELEAIRVLAESGEIVIAGGGGGIPVSTRGGHAVRDGRGHRQGPLLGGARASRSASTSSCC